MKYIFHCAKCHHEWEAITKENKICDWCGAKGDIINESKIPDYTELLKRIRIE